MLTHRPHGGLRSLALPEAREKARKLVEEITQAKQEAFAKGTYPPVGLPLKGQAQGTCFFATEPFGAGKNPGLTLRIRKGVKTYVRCYLPPWWKNVAGAEPVMLVGRNPGTGSRVPVPKPTAELTDFVLNTALFGDVPSAETISLSFTHALHDIVLKAGPNEIVVGKDRSFTRVAGGEVLWDP